MDNSSDKLPRAQRVLCAEEGCLVRVLVKFKSQLPVRCKEHDGS